MFVCRSSLCRQICSGADLLLWCWRRGCSCLTGCHAERVQVYHRCIRMGQGRLGAVRLDSTSRRIWAALPIAGVLKLLGCISWLAGCALPQAMLLPCQIACMLL